MTDLAARAPVLNQPPPDPLLKKEEERRQTFHTLRTQRDIDWFFEKRKTLFLRERYPIDAAWVRRGRPHGAAPLLFFFVVSKRKVREAHDRNTMKRRMREGARLASASSRIADLAMQEGIQIVVMLRAQEQASKDLTSDKSREIIERYLDKLLQTLTRTFEKVEGDAPILRKR